MKVIREDQIAAEETYVKSQAEQKRLEEENLAAQTREMNLKA